jgi:putative N6-adenine-specific DNA methylase
VAPTPRPRPPTRSRHRAFAVCTPGLEGILAGELTSLGITSARTTRGGVEFNVTNRQLYLANVWLRTATRVVVRIGDFDARQFDELERRAAAIAWDRWVAPDSPVEFRVHSSGSRLYHTDAIAERLGRVVPGRPAPSGGDAAGPDPADDESPPAQLVVVRVRRDRFTISVDSSGLPLHKRGWRTATAKAPLRETLAAALLLAVGWNGDTPLVDPFCGSGTIPIEAALLGAGVAPGRGRSFAFQRWPAFEPGAWASVAAGIDPVEAGGTGTNRTVAIVGHDRDAGAVESARANAERAGVSGLVSFSQAPISDLDAPPGGPGWLICNPPYGTRLSTGHDLRNLFATVGKVAARSLPGWGVGLLVADTRSAAHSGLALTECLHTTNGGLPVRFLFAAPAGPS